MNMTKDFVPVVEQIVKVKDNVIETQKEEILNLRGKIQEMEREIEVLQRFRDSMVELRIDL